MPIPRTAARLGACRPLLDARVARPPGALDVDRPAAPGQGRVRGDEDLRLLDPDRGRLASPARSRARSRGSARTSSGFPILPVDRRRAWRSAVDRDPGVRRRRWATEDADGQEDKAAGERGALIAVLWRIVLALIAPGARVGARDARELRARARRRPREAPEAVELRFSEPVEASFGSVRVFRRQGEALDGPENFRPDDDEPQLGVRPAGRPGDGTYTATYRVISADSHPVSGGFVFSVGDAGAAPVRERLGSARRLGGRTRRPRCRRRSRRFLTYAATALAVGVFAFALLVFAPGRAPSRLREMRPRRDRSLSPPGADAAPGSRRQSDRGRRARHRHAGRDRRRHVGLGRDRRERHRRRPRDAVRNRLGHPRARLGWSTRDLAASAAAPGPGCARSWLVPARGASWSSRRASPATRPPTAPSGCWSPRTIGHVAAMSIWVGGVAALAFARPRRDPRRSKPADRTRLLSATLLRFSRIALGERRRAGRHGHGAGDRLPRIRLGPLGHRLRARGRGEDHPASASSSRIGVVHRRRSLPLLREAADGGSAPGRGGKVAMRALRRRGRAVRRRSRGDRRSSSGEPPPGAAAEGPQSASADLGDSAARRDRRPGPDGIQRDPPLSLQRRGRLSVRRAQATSSSRRACQPRTIGPLEIDLEKSGPGHYTAPDAVLGVPGTWELELSGRISRFEDLTRLSRDRNHSENTTEGDQYMTKTSNRSWRRKRDACCSPLARRRT